MKIADEPIEKLEKQKMLPQVLQFLFKRRKQGKKGLLTNIMHNT